MAKNYKKLFMTSFLTLLSTMICAFGVCFYIHAQVGSDPIDMLVEGIHLKTQLTLGQADLLYSFVCLVLAAIVSRKHIGLVSIIYTLLIGILVDVANMVIEPLKLAEAGYAVRLLAVCLGQICFVVFYAIFQKIPRGMNTLDAIVFWVSEKLHISYAAARTGVDVFIFLLGLLLGGKAGIGTLIFVFTTGWLTSRAGKLVDKILPEGYSNG